MASVVQRLRRGALPLLGMGGGMATVAQSQPDALPALRARRKEARGTGAAGGGRVFPARIAPQSAAGFIAWRRLWLRGLPRCARGAGVCERSDVSDLRSSGAARLVRHPGV